MTNPVATVINSELEMRAEKATQLGNILKAYNAQSERLLGFLLKLSYEDMRIVTCDVWKSKCAGVPRNSFVVVKLLRPGG
jgi:hypothetical protein